MLDIVSRDKTEYVLSGDLNIDLLGDSVPKSRLLNDSNSLGIVQLIKDPTRVTLNSATLLDPVFVSFPCKVQ